MLHRGALIVSGAVALTIAVMNFPFTQAADAQGCQARCNNICSTKASGAARRFAMCMDRCPSKCAAKRAAKAGGGMAAGRQRRGE